jgi:hypothetical protein
MGNPWKGVTNRGADVPQKPGDCARSACTARQKGEGYGFRGRKSHG